MTISKQSVAKFLTASIHISGKLQKDIAAEIGYDKPNMITMLKKGHTALPLDKVGPLARALDVDPLHLFNLVMAEYYPETYEVLKPLLKGLELTEEELAVISKYRAITDKSGEKIVMGVIVS